MAHDRETLELIRAIKANTRATEALHALLLDIERTRRAEQAATGCEQNHDPISEN